MEDNVTLTREEYMELIRIKVRVEALADVMREIPYLSLEMITAMLGIEVKHDG